MKNMDRSKEALLRAKQKEGKCGCFNLNWNDDNKISVHLLEVEIKTICLKIIRCQSNCSKHKKKCFDTKLFLKPIKSRIKTFCIYLSRERKEAKRRGWECWREGRRRVRKWGQSSQQWEWTGCRCVHRIIQIAFNCASYVENCIEAFIHMLRKCHTELKVAWYYTTWKIWVEGAWLSIMNVINAPSCNFWWRCHSRHQKEKIFMHSGFKLSGADCTRFELPVL